MSRSYRKPWTVDGYGSKGKRKEKQFANKAVRNTAGIPNGKAYRKFYCSWNIADYKWLTDTKPYFSNLSQQWEEPLTPAWKARRK